MAEFDPCECVCSPQWAMRRLLSALRSSQQYCNDNECLTDGSIPQDGIAAGGQDGGGMFYIMLAWVLVATLLFFLRPSSLRRTGDEKPRDNSRSGPGNPPPTVQ